jgi:hypothetical protein
MYPPSPRTNPHHLGEALMRRLPTPSTSPLVRGEEAAFTLIELAIVLVTLGLLVGGVLVGQSLIRSAQLHGVITDYENRISAIKSFKTKYDSIPGDMSNATEFWGTASGGCPFGTGTGTQTCNGDGNRLINHDEFTSSEHFRFWQHLANANLIEGNYTGIRAGTWWQSSTTANSPKGTLPNSLWFTINWGLMYYPNGQPFIFGIDYTNTLQLAHAEPNEQPFSPLFKPGELWSIDTKIDDGKPATGKLVARAQGSPPGLSTCTTTIANDAQNLAADYLLSNSGITCAAMFPRAY